MKNSMIHGSLIGEVKEKGMFVLVFDKEVKVFLSSFLSGGESGCQMYSLIINGCKECSYLAQMKAHL